VGRKGSGIQAAISLGAFAIKHEMLNDPLTREGKIRTSAAENARRWMVDDFKK